MALSLAPGPVQAQQGGAPVHVASVTQGDAVLSGRARVLDADTIEVAGARLRLYGIDAPEDRQMCRDARGRDWACGAWATREARALVRGQRLACTPIRQDRYGRIVARCALPSGADLGATLVEAGVALAYRTISTRYVAQERVARAAHRGVWSGEIVPPWEWRAARRARHAAASHPPDPDCTIKGNISERGRIYHVPGSPSYDRTSVNEARGQRWFCSVEEAEAAGWRAPRGG
ncbi:MAG: thermonuclease family protein [Rhodobacteraceae bacterium]|nr:thermonuclease family protein [Paracoccaceae bacterium]